MDPLILAIALSAFVAIAFGILCGITIAFVRAEGNSLDHPWLAALAARRNPLLNALGGVVVWGSILYVVPRLTLAIVGISDTTALVLIGFLQLCSFGLALLAGERLWKVLK
jgi:hypothetical protein